MLPPPALPEPPTDQLAFEADDTSELSLRRSDLLLLSDEDLRCALHLRASGCGIKQIATRIVANYPGFALSSRVVREALRNADSSYKASTKTADLTSLFCCPGCDALIPRSTARCLRCRYEFQQFGCGGNENSGQKSPMDKIFKDVGLSPDGKKRIYQHMESAHWRVPVDVKTAEKPNSRNKNLKRWLEAQEGKPKQPRPKRPADSKREAVDVKEPDAPAEAAKEKGGKAKAQRLEPTFRQRCWSRPNETEEERRTRVRAAAGTRTERLQKDRAQDLQVSSALQDQCTARGIDRDQIWPPPAEKDATPISHLNNYYDKLFNAASGRSIFSPHTCPNCKQRATDHAPDASGLCWFCRDPKRAPALHNDNIDLDLDPHAPGISRDEVERRIVWADLRADYGELRYPPA